MDIEPPVANQTLALKSDALAGFVDKRKGTGKKAMKVIKTVVPKAKAAPKANTKKTRRKCSTKHGSRVARQSITAV